MQSDDKPEGHKAGWHRLGTRYPFATTWLKLREDHVRLDGNGEINFAYVENRGAAGVVPVMPDGKIVLIRQYRYTVDEWCYEIPAGGLHDTGDMERLEVARQELRQETGGTCEAIEHVGYFYTSIGNSSQAFHIYLARGVRLEEPQVLEATEHIEVVPTPAPEALRMARSGQVRDGSSALALLMCEELLRQYGYV